MAKVHQEFKESYESIHVKSLKKPVLFIVDMIHGFIHEGALHDASIHAITPAIIQLIKTIDGRVIFVADSHPQEAREFISYPPHCLHDTKESEVIDELQPYVQELFHKNSTNTFHCSEFEKFLEQIDLYQDIIITGCCSDICILQFVLSLQSWLNEHQKMNQRIIVPVDMIDTYHIDAIHDAIRENEFSIRNMRANGIHIVCSIESEN